MGVLLACVLSPSVVDAKQEVASSVSAQQVALYVKVIEDFLNSIRTWRADFLEINSAGKEVKGLFLLKKSPAMLKMDYKDPPLRLIVVKNHKITYYDKELKEKSVTSTHSSPLSFFLDFKINLKDNVKVISCSKFEQKLIIIFRKKEDKDAENGVVRIVFNMKSSNSRVNKGKIKGNVVEQPLQLECWEISKSMRALERGEFTRVCLKNQKINQFISDEEFN